MENDRLVLKSIARTGRIFHAYIRQECDKIGINCSFQGIIRILSKENGLSQLDLAKKLVLAPPTVSLTLQKMEYVGYIERKPDADDARITRVYLTEKGFSVDEQIIAIFKKVEKRMANIIPVEQQELLFALLDNIDNELLLMQQED